MEALIKQIRIASENGLFYLALYGALTLPDICGALESKNGRASGAKYKKWIRSNVAGQAEEADELYGLRCSLVHQGQSLPHGGHFPIAFMAPGAPRLHNLSTMVGDDQVGWISIELLVDEVTKAAEIWLEEYGETQIVKRNMEKFARLRPEGLPPHVSGPVIA